MERPAQDSKAFRDATLRSDRARTRVILAAVSVLALVIVIRIAAFQRIGGISCLVRGQFFGFERRRSPCVPFHGF